MATTRSLRDILHDGEIVRYSRSDRAYEATFEDGQLVYEDTSQCFRSLSSFASFFTGYCVNGWKVCKVQRDGKWVPCEKLQPLDGATTAANPKGKAQSKSMPPKSSQATSSKKAAVPAPVPVKKKGKAAESVPAPTITIRRAKVPPATIPSTIVASIIESAEPPLEVNSIVRIMLRRHEHASKSYWRDGKKEKLFSREANGGVGSYVGRWNATTQMIDTSVPDSDMEN